eukprot:scaffold196792_cov71-Cyclotella_meneghiniana.AAC.1
MKRQLSSKIQWKREHKSAPHRPTIIRATHPKSEISKYDALSDAKDSELKIRWPGHEFTFS